MSIGSLHSKGLSRPKFANVPSQFESTGYDLQWLDWALHYVDQCL